MWNRKNVTASHAVHGVRPLDFTWSFSLPGDASSVTGTLQITVDNAYRVLLNGLRVGTDGELDRMGTDGSWTTVESYAIHPVAGNNTITVRAVNDRDTAPFDNPAGIAFRADISYES